MLLASAGFLFLFLPIFLLLFMVIPDKYKKHYLLLASVAFYVLANLKTPLSVAVLWFAVLFSYFFGGLLSKYHRRWLLGVGVGVHIASLLALRLFFCQSGEQDLLKYPVGAAIFLLCGISYLVEHYRHGSELDDNLFDTALYICFFPVLLAGPVIRYGDFREAVGKLGYRMDNFARGVRFFCVGLIKRVAVAAVLSEAFEHILQYSNLQVNVGIGLLSLFLMYLIVFFAFSGYSDMGVGLCVMMGMPMSPDFEAPFLAVSPLSYCHRFFISFYGFFRDYVIEPMEKLPFGSPRLKQTLGELLYVLCLTLWFRMDWFVCLTALPLLLLVILERLPRVERGLRSRRIVRLAGWFVTLVMMSGFWTMQRLDSYGQLWQYFENLWQVSGTYESLYTFVTSIGVEFLLVTAGAVLVILPLSMGKTYRTGVCTTKKEAVWLGFLTAVILGLFLLTLVYFLPQFPQFAVRPYLYFDI